MSFGVLENRLVLGRVQIDYRIGGVPRYYIGDANQMLIPDEMRKCVAFAEYQTRKKGWYGMGTVFFISCEAKPNTLGAPTYAVTAKHVCEGAMKDARDGKIVLRLNFRDDLVRIETDASDWLSHPSDDSVDVAVYPFEFPDNIDQLAYPTYGFATQETINRESIGLGDEIFTIGLFAEHFGTKRNIPIVRVGNIAAMPEEPVNTKEYGKIEAYLVEARSISGLSGSPVFVHLGGVRSYRGNVLAQGNRFYLLGLMHGHWDRAPVKESDSGIVEPKDESVNLGIAIVVPATKILEVINQPKLEEQRKLALNNRVNLPTPDGH